MRAVEYKNSFERLCKKLSPHDKQKISKAIEDFLQSLEKNEFPKGLGLKRLMGDQWEIRVDSRLRIYFLMSKERIEFGGVGNHEDVRNFLKNI